MSGFSAEIVDPGERVAVHEAIPYGAFKKDDPIFRLTIERALWISWERAGKPDTKPKRRRWPPGRGAG